MMYGLYNNWGAGNMMGYFSDGVMMLVFWALVIYFIIWVVRGIGGKNSKSNKDALDVLKERYVKGEITKDQFEAIKKDISSV